MKKLNLRHYTLGAFVTVLLISINANYNAPLPDKWWVDYSHTTFFLGIYSFWLVYIIDQAKRHSQMIILDHTPYFIERLFTAAGLTLFFSWFQLERMLPLMLFFGSTFWMSFDFTYNIFRGHSLFYIGRTAWIDKRTYKIPRLSFLLKTALILVSIHWYLEVV